MREFGFLVWDFYLCRGAGLTLNFGLSCPRHFQHLLAEIQAGHLNARPRQSKRKIAGAAADIQGAKASLRTGQPDQAPLPVSVQAEALHIIEQIIARRDGGKEGLYLRGALFAWIIELVRHTSAGGKPTAG